MRRTVVNPVSDEAKNNDFLRRKTVDDLESVRFSRSRPRESNSFTIPLTSDNADLLSE
jgi:hypothetical protein